MKKEIIHVGLHKTATTYLQENVWPMLTSYTYLSRPYTQHNHAFNILQYADDSLYDKDLMEKEVAQFSTNRVLISDESLSGKPVYFSYINRSLIAKRLAELLPNAEIILFLRDQQDMLVSHYNSYVAMPYGTKRIEKFLYKPNMDYTFKQYKIRPTTYEMSTLYFNTNDYFVHLDCFLYSHLVQLYRRFFTKVHVFLYEDFHSSNEETISRLSEILGEKIVVKLTRRRNVSLSRRSLEKRRKANKICYGIENEFMRKIARKLVSAVALGDSGDLRTRVREIVNGYYTEDNAKLKLQLAHLNWDRHRGKYN